MNILPAKHIAWWTLAWVVSIELITLLFRFGFGLQSTRDTASTIGVLTGGVRIHHGYVGILILLIVVFLVRRHRAIAQRLSVIGLSLCLSDLVHHFFILWMVVGSPEFHLTYSS